jgi:hypothetical protein
MVTKSSAGQKVASLVVGMAILVPGLFFMVLGVTFLPVIGIIMGLPIMALSVGFMMVSLRQDVESLEVTEMVEQDAVSVTETLETAPKEPEFFRIPLLEADGDNELHPPIWKKAA